MICLCLLYFYHNRSLKKFFPLIVLILIVAVTNPLFVQRGRTILYADTHIRITKEALLYGIHYGCVLVNLLLVFSIFNQYIKKEQWIYLSGRFFPKLGVVTSMAFGLIPRYQNHAKKILNTRKSLKSAQAVQRVMNTVSMETTWAFESSMDQLDSMSARGYGIRKRTHFHLFRWERNDWIHIVEIVILTILNLWAYIHYYSRFFFYPMIIMPAFQMRDQDQRNYNRGSVEQSEQVGWLVRMPSREHYHRGIEFRRLGLYERGTSAPSPHLQAPPSCIQ